jgi:probable rRNA maturation factor
MQLNIYNWEILKEHLPKVQFSKKDLQETLFKEFSNYNLNKVRGISNIETLNVVSVSPREIKQLNKDFRKKNTVTDVLSFILEENPLIGEIYVCPEYIVKKYDHTEVLRVIVHGFLHLLGYEHTQHFKGGLESKEDMFVKQENMLQNILYEINNRFR